MTPDLREKLARAVANGLGDDFDHAFVSKPEWTNARGEKGGRYRDINEPFQSDYLDAVSTILSELDKAGWQIVEKQDVARKVSDR